MFKKKPSSNTSWEPVQKWYHSSVGEEGHYYHQKIVLPGVLKLLNLRPGSSLLDIACGNGVLARQLPKNIYYEGLDLSSSLIKEAKKMLPSHPFHISDITKPFPIKKTDFSHAAIVLAIQNVEQAGQVFLHAGKHLTPGGTLVIVMNHPCFRIPRQSSWKVDEAQKMQYRRIDRYSSPLQIPIQAEPSKGEKSAQTWSFHVPLSQYSKWLQEAGFMIELIEEWHSDKISTGKNAKMENRSREEFPLFMAIKAKLIP